MITWMRCAGLAWLAMVIGLALGCASPHGPKVSGRHQQPVSDVPPPDSPEVTDADPPTILPETHMSAGRLHESQNQFLRAAEQYQLAIKLKPDHVAAYNRLGIVLDRLGRYEKADETFRRAIQLAPDQAYLHNNLAFSCILQSHWTEAEIELTRALELQPNFARARVNLAMVLAQQSRFEEALNQFQTALSAAEAYYNIGLMYQSKRKPVEAAQAFAQALELNPKLVAAGKRLEQLPADVVSAAHQRGSLNFHTAQTASPAPSEPIEPGQARLPKAQPTTGPSPAAKAPYVSNASETTKSPSPNPCGTGFQPVDSEGLGMGSYRPVDMCSLSSRGAGSRSGRRLGPRTGAGNPPAGLCSTTGQDAHRRLGRNARSTSCGGLRAAQRRAIPARQHDQAGDHCGGHDRAPQRLHLPHRSGPARRRPPGYRFGRPFHWRSQDGPRGRRGDHRRLPSLGPEAQGRRAHHHPRRSGLR